MPGAVPVGDFRLFLRSEDQAPRELQELDQTELESLKTAIDSALARRRADELQATGARPDVGFSCEWWPPD
jgi:hypothetical protein